MRGTINAMRILPIVLGILLIGGGLVWIAQGLNLSWAPQSLMTADRAWVLIGAVAALAGCVLIGWTRQRAQTRRAHPSCHIALTPTRAADISTLSGPRRVPGRASAIYRSEGGVKVAPRPCPRHRATDISAMRGLAWRSGQKSPINRRRLDRMDQLNRMDQPDQLDQPKAKSLEWSPA